MVLLSLETTILAMALLRRPFSEQLDAVLCATVLCTSREVKRGSKDKEGIVAVNTFVHGSAFQSTLRPFQPAGDSFTCTTCTSHLRVYCLSPMRLDA